MSRTGATSLACWRVLKARAQSSDEDASSAAKDALATYEKLDNEQKRAFVSTYWAEGGARGRKDLKFVKEFSQELTHNKLEVSKCLRGYMAIPEVMDHLKQDPKFYSSLDDYISSGLAEIAMNKQLHGTIKEDIIHPSNSWSMHRYWYVREAAQENTSSLDIQDKINRSSTDSKTAMSMLCAASASQEEAIPNKEYDELQELAQKFVKLLSDFQSRLNQSMLKAKEYKASAQGDEGMKDIAYTFINRLKEEVQWTDDSMDDTLSHKNLKKDSEVAEIKKSTEALTKLEEAVLQKHTMIKELTQENSSIFTSV